MAATHMRCTMILKNDRFSITETHVIADPNFDSCKPKFIRLFNKRMAIAAVPTSAYRGRMSAIEIGAGTVKSSRQVLLLDESELPDDSSVFPQTTGSSDGGLTDVESDQAKSSVLLKLYNTDYSAVHNQYLAGIPDLVVRENPEGPSVDFSPLYRRRFNAYTAELETGWGFVGKIRDNAFVKLTQVLPTIQVDPIVLDLGFTVSGALPSAVIGSKVFLTDFKAIARPYKVPNGTWLIRKVSTDFPDPGQNTAYLLNTQIFDATKIQFPGKMGVYGLQFFGYSHHDVAQQTTRKRGNRSLAYPGARRKPVRV